VRATIEAHTLSRAIQEQLRQTSGLPIGRIRTMDEVVARSTARQSFDMLLLSIFGCAALLLAAIGIYGLMAYSVAQRRQELAIRMALGARWTDVRNMVVWEGMRLAIVGVVLGAAAASNLTQLMANLLVGVKPWDPVVILVVPVLLTAVAFAAVWLPTVQATRVDPAIALRYE
jgi:putative ABC transport system permease protein